MSIAFSLSLENCVYTNICTPSTGRLHLFQCKKVKSFTAAQIRAAAKKFLNGKFKDQADAFTLCCTCSLRNTKLNEAKTEFCANPGFEIWDHQELSTRLKHHPSIIETAFGEPWRHHFCDSQAPEAIDWDKARQQLHNKFLYLGFGGAGVVPSDGADFTLKPPKLDAAYHELSFIAEGKTERRTLLTADLLDLTHRLILRGRGGSGKTTWVRRSCQRLLDEPTCFPLLIELRDMAYKWKNCGGNIETYLKDWLAEYSIPEAVAHQLLKRQVDIKPFLFVDGWDELGSLGDELRGKLKSFLDAHPHFNCIVTSRPYGTGRPNGEDGFALLDVAPLTPEEVEVFSANYYLACCPGDEPTAKSLHLHFSKALQRSSSARDLTDLPLLLTMMLIISIKEPLPDQRHNLYERCISGLLSAIPDKKEQEGAQLQAAEWRPEKSEDRLRILAELAFQMKTGKLESSEQGIICDWKLAFQFLPDKWTVVQKEGFLRWLCNRAGLLRQSHDDSFVFTHLSFQEFLAAWHAKESIEGQDRITFAQQRLKDRTWWEALRLWAAIVNGARPKNWEPVMDELLKSDDGLCLAGAILADGTGSPESFDGWCRSFFHRLSQQWLPKAHYCLQAFSSAREFPREILQQIVDEVASQATAFGWLRLQRWGSYMALSVPQPKRKVPSAWASAFSLTVSSKHLKQRKLSHESFAVGRHLAGGFPFWPALPQGLLNAWQNRRRSTSQILENWILTKDTVPDGGSVHWIWPKAATEEDTEWARKIASEWAGDLPRGWVRDLARDWASDLARYWTRELATEGDHAFMLHLVSDSKSYWKNEFIFDWTSDLARNWDRATSENFRYDFVSAEFHSPFRAVARSLLKHLPLNERDPIVKLVQLGARRSMPSEIPIGMDPLWPAFARHLGRQSTPEDRALLESLAANPEQRPGQLGLALRFLVRGDVLYPDGSFRTLDEIADEFGMPRLPLLEEVPEDLDVDFD